MHIPVLKEEVLHFLNPQKNENFLDCTAGTGGHAIAILEKNGPHGRVLALEWDEDLYHLLLNKKEERLLVVNESYVFLEKVVQENNFTSISGILFDLGFCTFHVKQSGRGFTLKKDEPLDMRYNKNSLLTAKEIVNTYPEKNLIYLLKKWGEEDYAEEISSLIINERKKGPITTTQKLVNIIERSVPSSYQKGKIHCATKTFQALRIVVNGEILALQEALLQATRVLGEGGKMAIITFHGIEEKIVRDFFKKNELKIETPNPITPSPEEKKENISSRSAKLFAATKK